MDKKIFELVDKYKYIVFTVIIFLLGLYVRYINLHFLSPDFSKQFEVWFYKLGKYSNGLLSMKERIGDYNVIHQFLMLLLTYLPFEPVVSYKGVSILFDILMAYESGRLIYSLTKSKFKAYVIAAVVYMYPIAILNSGVWGQCDSMYTFFIIFSIRKMMEKKYTLSFVFFGLAIAFKLQAIFYLPFLVYAYFSKREFSIIHFLYAFLVFYATALPSLLVGGSLLGPLETYVYQVGLYENMGLNIINFWTLSNGSYVVLNFIAMFITMLILGIGLLYLDNNPKAFNSKQLEIAIWCIWTCVLFLPSMHERYPYAAEVLMLILVFKDLRFIPALFIQTLCSLQTYNFYLFGVEIQYSYMMAVLLMITYIMFTYYTFIKKEEV